MADGISVWVPVISTLSGGILTGSIALLVSRLNHRYAGEREALAAAERHRHELKIAQELLDKERLFIATELIFLLEQFAEGCARMATDCGEPDPQGVYTPTENLPELIIKNISGDWRALPPRLCTGSMNFRYFRMKSGDISRLIMSSTGSLPISPHIIGNVSSIMPVSG